MASIAGEFRETVLRALGMSNFNSTPPFLASRSCDLRIMAAWGPGIVGKAKLS
jgi:hypothetical protein